jgi:hypothetical protein
MTNGRITVSWLGATLAMTLASTAAFAQVSADGDAVGIGIGNANSDATSTSLAVANPIAVNNPTALAGLNARISIEQVFQGNRRVIQPPTGLAPTVQIPQLFSTPTIPTPAKGIPLTLLYFNACQPMAQSGVDVRETHERGASRNTDVVFLPHPQYVGAANHNERGNRVAVDTVRVAFPSQAGNYDCLGMLSINARKRQADKVQMFGLINDAQQFVRSELSGFPEVELLCAQNAVSANLGVRSSGFGAALSAGATNLGEQSSTLGTLLGGLTGQFASNFPDSQIGVTCIVAKAGGATPLDLSGLNNNLGPFVAAPNVMNNPELTMGVKAAGAAQANNGNGILRY